MSKLTKLETLQKAVVDTYAAWDAFDAFDAADAAAFDAWVKAKRELNNCLKEQDDE
tara:strand:+ start:358 stop:525 length:168 start_codon:yes stop_codon:yes gene_type:complete